MRSKKTPRAKKFLVRGRRIGLTSAIGPKATTAVVIVVLAGGLWFGSHQRLAAKTKTPTASVETQTEFAPAPATAATVAKEHDASAPSAATDTATKSAKVPVTTLQGCLERDGDTFRLKDTSGPDAPKARSWKSGFIKKGAATVDVVDASDSLGLGNRVGTRVSVTGPLVDRQIQARSVRRIASTCN